MRVGIIGAGLSGLAAARELIESGHEVRVFEKSRGVGGRLAARRIGGTVVDHGAPVITTPPDGELDALVRSLDQDDLVRLGPDRVAYRSGATRLAKLMADGIDVTLGVRIAALRPSGGRFELGDEQGNSHGCVDAVVISAPAPQAADLLEQSPQPAACVDALREVVYDSAVVVMAGLRIAPPQELEPFSVTAPFARITAESARGRAPVADIAAVVAHVAPEASAELLGASDADVLDRLLPRMMALCGAETVPEWTSVKRWRFATARAVIDSARVNPSGSRIVVCGDAVAGDGLEDVLRSGRAAAHAVSS